MKLISSRTNPVVKQLVELASARERALQQLCIAEGFNTCATLVQSSKIRLEQLFVTVSMVKKAQHLASDDKITQVCDPVMQKISQSCSPSGILGLFHIPQQLMKKELSGPGLILAQVRDPGNVGTLLRSAAAFGISSVILVESADVWSPKVIQSTVGTIGVLDIFVMSWQEVYSLIPPERLCALVVRDGQLPTNLTLSRSFLIVGNESQGIPEAWIAQCGQRMTLPMPGNTESLNAAIAGAIGLYEMSLQRP